MVVTADFEPPLHSSKDQPDFRSESFDLEESLRVFYSKFFPFDRIYRWLSYSADVSRGPYFVRREFSMTLENQTYIRFLSFLSEVEMRDRIVAANPVKIDIGAVYSARPSEKKFINSASFVPVERELVFDIDLTDYDDIRKCCKEKQMCINCWQFIVAAVKVLDPILRNDFGFKNILWVFSGRRGIHCWVADKRARILDSGLRKAIISYIDLFRKPLSSAFHEVHPMIKRSLSTISHLFKKKILFDLFNSDVVEEELINTLNDIVTEPENIIRIWERDQIIDPFERWKIIINDPSFTSKTSKAEEFIIKYLYPRLDSNVSIGLNHLLKSPFCVHPDTGKICVPIDPSTIDTFNPDLVPKIGTLLNSATDTPSVLQPYLTLMDDFINQLAQQDPL